VGSIIEFARDNDRPTVGFGSGLDQALGAIVPPTMLTRTDTSGVYFVRALRPYERVGGLLVIAALVLVAWKAHARHRSLSRLSVMALVLLGAGIVNGANVPDSVEAWRVNLYRWTWAGVLLTWTALGWAAGLLIARWLATTNRSDRAQRLAPVALVTAAVLVATSTVFVSGRDDHNREKPAFKLEKRVASAVLDRVDRDRPIVVVFSGYSATLAVGPHVLYRLVEAGVPVRVTRRLAPAYGRHRRYEREDGMAALVVSSGRGEIEDRPGEVIATEHYAPERSRLLEELADDVRGKEVVLAPGADELIEHEFPGAREKFIDPLIERLPTDPRFALEQPVFLELVDKGLFESPTFDEAKVHRLMQLLPEHNSVGADDIVEVRYLSPDEFREEGLPELD
jgi:hypothetical protein